MDAYNGCDGTPLEKCGIMQDRCVVLNNREIRYYVSFLSGMPSNSLSWFLLIDEFSVIGN